MGTTRIYVTEERGRSRDDRRLLAGEGRCKGGLAVGPTGGVQVAAADMSAQHWADSNGPWYAVIVTSDPAAMDN